MLAGVTWSPLWPSSSWLRRFGLRLCDYSFLIHTHPKVGGGRQGSSGHGVAGSLSVCAVFAQEPAELGREPVEHLCVVAVGHDGLTAAGE